MSGWAILMGPPVLHYEAAALDALNQYNLSAPAPSRSPRATYNEKHYIKGKYYCEDAVRYTVYETNPGAHTQTRINACATARAHTQAVLLIGVRQKAKTNLVHINIVAHCSQGCLIYRGGLINDMRFGHCSKFNSVTVVPKGS